MFKAVRKLKSMSPIISGVMRSKGWQDWQVATISLSGFKLLCIVRMRLMSFDLTGRGVACSGGFICMPAELTFMHHSCAQNI